MVTRTCVPIHEFIWALLIAQLVKNLPTMQETQVRFLGQEDPLEKEMANPLQYSCLGNPMNRGACGLQFKDSHRVWHDLATKQQPQ